MAAKVPGKAKELAFPATITLGQKIGMQAKSSRRRAGLKRKTPPQIGANQVFPGR
jgi:hypothetical protein